MFCVLLVFSMGTQLASPFLLNQGHSILVNPAIGTVRYEVNGSVLRRYLGGIKAKELETAELKGIFTVDVSKSEAGFMWVGKSEDVLLLKDGKGLPKGDAIKGWGGKWHVKYPEEEHVYTFNDTDKIPHSLNVPLWPVGWSWWIQKGGMRIGDEVYGMFQFPLQSLFEDDPIGRIPIPIKYVFEGPDRLGSELVYVFKIETKRELDLPVSHPEEKDLRLKGSLDLTGKIQIQRSTGTVEESFVQWKANFRLESERHPFGLAKAELLAGSSFRRLR